MWNNGPKYMLLITYLRENSKSVSTKQGNIHKKNSKNENRKPAQLHWGPSTYWLDFNNILSKKS